MNAISKRLAATPVRPKPMRSSLTFADLGTLIEGSAKLSAEQKRHLLSDLKVAAEMLELSPAAVPCDVVWLGQQLFRQPPTAFGKTKYRFGNILSSVRKALRLAGLHQPRTCGERDLPPDWVAVLDAATFQPQRAGLRSLARHCAAAGIPPQAFTPEVFKDFLAEERGTRLEARATKRGAMVARAWNQAIANGPGLEDCRPIQAPRQRVPYTFPPDHYPASFVAEYEAFKEHLSAARGRSIFRRRPTSSGAKNIGKARGALRRKRPATVKARCFAVLQAAAALVIKGHDPAAITGLRYLVEPIEHVDDIFEFYEERALAKLSPKDQENAEIVGGQLAMIADTLVVVARHEVGLEGEGLQQLLDVQKQVHPRQQRGLTGKVRERLLRLIQPYNRSRLLILAEDIEEAARKSGNLDETTARRIRAAIAVQVLLDCPLRMRNLARLRLDRHLPRLCPDGRWITHVVIGETETKGHDRIEWPVRPATARLLDAWIRTWRPLLAAGDPGNRYLFPGQKPGEPMSQNGFANAIRLLIEREIGLQVHPHLLRHFAAWRHLNRHPGQYEIVRRALGHASIETTVRAYCGLETEAAARCFHGALEDDEVEARRLVRTQEAARILKGRTKAAKGRR